MWNKGFELIFVVKHIVWTGSKEQILYPNTSVWLRQADLFSALQMYRTGVLLDSSPPPPPFTGDRGDASLETSM